MPPPPPPPPKFSIAFYYSAITCVAIAMSILKYIVPIRPGVSSKEDSDVRQTSGIKCYRNWKSCCVIRNVSWRIIVTDVMQLYGDDFNQQRMASQLLILHANLPHEIKSLVGGMKLKGIIAFLQSLSLIESELYTEVIKLAKLIIVMPATNAVSERTFSALRRLKTWLRSTMHQSRLNWCMLLHVHKDESGKLDLAIIGNEFASRNSSRQELFGIFP